MEEIDVLEIDGTGCGHGARYAARHGDGHGEGEEWHIRSGGGFSREDGDGFTFGFGGTTTGDGNGYGDNNDDDGDIGLLYYKPFYHFTSTIAHNSSDHEPSVW